MLIQRVRRWTSIKPALGEHILFPVSGSRQHVIRRPGRSGGYGLRSVRRAAPPAGPVLLDPAIDFPPSNYISPVSTDVPQQTLSQCWTSVKVNGPTLKQHCLNVSCSLLSKSRISILISSRWEVNFNPWKIKIVTAIIHIFYGLKMMFCN